MIEQKEHDWVLNLLNNEQLIPSDFIDVGLNADNTSLLDENVYKLSKMITENPSFLNEEGKFDENKFHNFYLNAAFLYNKLSDETYMNNLAQEYAKYGSDDIFAPKDKRLKKDELALITRDSNLYRQTTGLIRIGETATPTRSISEIALTLKVNTNPLAAAADMAKGIFDTAEWSDSPNDSWFKDFFDVLVLAQWDEEGTHIDPITGEERTHKKGDYKLNENGTAYYENLDGRDVYGKLVLNKMNTLTTDGSKWNLYDFFDSDDIELKSFGGTVLKNAALVGSMFIPYVGPWIAGASVATLMVGVFGTLGKMLTGSESPTLSWMEGWSKSLNRQTAKTDYAANNTWCVENFVGLIGDVMGQLTEQRMLFEFAPAIIKGNKTLGWNGISKTKTDKFRKDKYEEVTKFLSKKIDDLKKGGATDDIVGIAKSQAAVQASKESTDAVNTFVKSYQKIGEILSQGYMTAITTADMYGELKKQGDASDFEATMFTLGYAAAEAAILRSDLGNWILPELKGSKLRNLKILYKIAEGRDLLKGKTIESASREEKQSFARTMFQKGKELFQDLYSNRHLIKGTARSFGKETMANALGEGFEEVSEEALADFVRGTYNTVLYLLGDEGRLNIENVVDRYSMSLFGGMIGGGLTSAMTDFKGDPSPLTYETALLEMSYMIKNNKKGELIDALNKVTFADPNMSNEIVGESEGLPIYAATLDKTKSKDSEIKNVMLQTIDFIDNVYKSEGLKFTDTEFIKKSTFDDVRFALFENSGAAGLYLLEYNTLGIEITRHVQKIKNIENKATDTVQLAESDLLEISQLKAELNDLRKTKDKFHDGSYAMGFMNRAMFEMNPYLSRILTNLSFEDYAEARDKKKFSEISEHRKKTLEEDWKIWKSTEGNYRNALIADYLLKLSQDLSDQLKVWELDRDNLKRNKQLAQLNSLLDILSMLNLQGSMDMQELFNNNLNTMLETLIYYHNPDVVTRLRSLIPSEFVNEKDKLDVMREYREQLNQYIVNNIDSIFDSFINNGTINPEIKLQLERPLYQIYKDYKNAVNSLFGILKIINEYKVLQTIQNPEKKQDELIKLKEDADNFIVKANDLLTSINIDGFAFNGDILNAPTASDVTLDNLENFANKLTQIYQKIESKLLALLNAPYTNIVEVLNLVGSKFGKRIDPLLKKVDSVLDDNNNLDEISLDEIYEDLNQWLDIFKFVDALVTTSETDREADFNVTTGINSTLNDLALKNHVPDWKPLSTLGKDTANIARQDMRLLLLKLEKVKAIIETNNGRKLLTQDKISTNKLLITFEKLLSWVNSGDLDDWARNDLLKNAVSEAKTLLKFVSLKNADITLDERDTIEEEMVKIEDEIHAFFAANTEKLNNGELSNLFSKDLNLFDMTELLLEADTKSLSDRNFISYLASRAALSRSKFIHHYVKVMDLQLDLVPLAPLEEAIFFDVAHVTNNNMFRLFQEAYSKALQTHFDAMSDSEKENALRNADVEQKDILSIIKGEMSLLTLNILPKFGLVSFTNGGAGVGKTQLKRFTIAILEDMTPGFTNNAFVVHATEKDADDIAKKYNLKNYRVFDRRKILDYVQPEYSFLEGSSIKYDENDFNIDEDGTVEYKLQSGDGRPPSLIIIDEMSHFAEPELDLTLDYAIKYNIPILTSGDHWQSSTKAEIILKNKTTVNLTTAHTLFLSAPKLSFSMRSTNSQVDKTLQLYYRRKLQLMLNPNKTIGIDVYYSDANGFSGVRAFDKSNSSITIIHQEIDKLMLENPDVTFNYIYYDEDLSEVHKYLSSKYSDRAIPHKGGAQGREGLYYIVDFAGISEKDNDIYERDFYTAMSRAQEGTLLFNTGSSVVSHYESTSLNTRIPPSILDRYTQRKKVLYKRLDTATEGITLKKSENSENNNIESKTIVDNSKPKPSGAPEETLDIGKSVTLDGVNYQILNLKENNGEWLYLLVDDYGNKIWKNYKDLSLTVVDVPKDFNPNLELKDIPLEGNTYRTDGINVGIHENGGIRMISSSSDLANSVIELAKDELETYDEDSNNTVIYNQGLYSFNAASSGLREEEIDGGYTRIQLFDFERDKNRIDGILGYFKMLSVLAPTENLRDFYKSRVWELINDKYIDVKTDELNLWKQDLRSMQMEILAEKPVKIGGQTLAVSELGYLSSGLLQNKSYYLPKNGPWTMLDRHKDEQSLGSLGDKSSNIIRKGLVATLSITRDGETYRLLIPLVNFAHVRQFVTNPLSPVASALNALINQYSKLGNAILAIKDGKLRNMLAKEASQDASIEKELSLIEQTANIYSFSGLFYYPLKGISIKEYMDDKGPQVNIYADSSGYKKFEGKPVKLTDLKNLGAHLTEHVYATTDFRLAHPGHSFVLYSFIEFNNDKEMLDQWERLLRDDYNDAHTVGIAYVTPPSVSIDTYLRNLFNIVKHPKNKNYQTNLGVNITSFRILELLVLANKIQLTGNSKLAYDLVLEATLRVKDAKIPEEKLKANNQLRYALRGNHNNIGKPKNLFNKIIVEYFSKDQHIDNDKLNELNEFLKDKITIRYDITHDNTLNSNSSFKKMDVNNYQINGLSLEIHGKIDTNVLVSTDKLLNELKELSETNGDISKGSLLYNTTNDYIGNKQNIQSKKSGSFVVSVNNESIILLSGTYKKEFLNTSNKTINDIDINIPTFITIDDSQKFEILSKYIQNLIDNTTDAKRVYFRELSKTNNSLGESITYIVSDKGKLKLKNTKRREFVELLKDFLNYIDLSESVEFEIDGFIFSLINNGLSIREKSPIQIEENIEEETVELFLDNNQISEKNIFLEKLFFPKALTKANLTDLLGLVNSMIENLERSPHKDSNEQISTALKYLLNLQSKLKNNNSEKNCRYLLL